MKKACMWIIAVLIIFTSIFLLLLALFFLYRNSKAKCPHCKAIIDKSMYICPMCGIELEEEGTER